MKTFLKTTIACALIIGSAVAVNAQEQDPKAKAILEELTKKNKAHKSVSLDFEYNLKNKDEDIDESQDGKLLASGKRYKLDIAGQVIYCDGKTIWTHIVDAEEVQINDMPDEDEDSENLMNPANIFTMYEKGFKYKYVGEETIDGAVMQIIDLYPIKANDKSFHTIRLVIDKVKKEMKNIIVKGKDGNVYTYTLKNFKINPPVTDGSFQFDKTKFPGIEEIDLRD